VFLNYWAAPNVYAYMLIYVFLILQPTFVIVIEPKIPKLI